MKTKKTTLFIVLTLCVMQLTAANVWYVRSLTGNDTSGDGSLVNPWQTLSGAYANESVLSGDTLNVSGSFTSDNNITFSKSIVIHGTDKTTAIFDGTGLNTSFGKITSANSGKTVTIENVTIKNYNAYVSSAISQGGVIAILGTGSNVTLRNCVFKNNSATQGGVIHLANTSTNTPSSLTIHDCHFDSNLAKATTSGTIYNGQGGAININANAYTYTISIDRCLFENNSSDTGYGSSICYICSGASTSLSNLTIQNSTFFGNQLTTSTSSTTNRGCIYLQPATSYGSAKLINNTIAFNTSSYSGQYAGVFVNGSNVTLINNILFGNTYQSIANVSSVSVAESRNNITDVASTLYNWTTKTTAGMYSGNTNSITASQLSLSTSLEENGGKTKTLALQSGSLAIDAGYTTGVPTVDQRNFMRMGTIDIGAFEFSGTTLLPSTNSVIDYQLLPTVSGIHVNHSGDVTIELYTIDGMLIDKTISKGSYSRDLKNGLYIIRINGKANKFLR